MKYIPKLFLALMCSSLITLVGCRVDEPKVEKQDLKVPRLMIESRGNSYGSRSGKTVTLPVSGTTISIDQEPLVDEFEIVNVDLVKVDMGLALLIQVTEDGGKALYRGSVANNGNRIALMLNGTVVGARRIDGAITDGRFFTFVEIPDDELEELVIDIKKTIAYLATQYSW